MRPVLKPAMRRLWRDRCTLQLGLDPHRAVVLDGVDQAMAQLLELLDGTRDEAGVVATAARDGLGGDRAVRLLGLLAGGSALDDAAAGSRAELRPVLALPRAERERLAPDLASLSLVAPAPGAALATLARRRRAHVVVIGAGRVGAPLAALLAAAGVGRVGVVDDGPARLSDTGVGGLRCADEGTPRGDAVRGIVAAMTAAPDVAPSGADGRPDLVLLAPVAPGGLEVADGLLRDGVPHLVARVIETTGIVGPLVLPGRSACVRCQDLHRAERDPAWPLLVAQLSTPVRSSVDPCDSALATVVAAHAALQALGYLDADTHAVGTAVRADLLATVGGTLELRLPDWRLRRRSWPCHPACGCTWAQTG